MQEKVFELSLKEVFATMPRLTAEELVEWFLETLTGNEEVLRLQFNRLGDGENARIKEVMRRVNWAITPLVLREKQGAA